MRAPLFLVVLLAAAPAIGAEYGTPAACAAVAQGHDPEEIAGGVIGEDLSYFFDGAVFVGPEYVCEIVAPGPSNCFLGGDEPTVFDIRTEVMADRAIVLIEGADPVSLKPCPAR